MADSKFYTNIAELILTKNKKQRQVVQIYLQASTEITSN